MLPVFAFERPPHSVRAAPPGFGRMRFSEAASTGFAASYNRHAWRHRHGAGVKWAVAENVKWLQKSLHPYESVSLQDVCVKNVLTRAAGSENTSLPIEVTGHGGRNVSHGAFPLTLKLHKLKLQMKVWLVGKKTSHISPKKSLYVFQVIRKRYILQNSNGNTLMAITGHDMEQYAWTEEDIEMFLSIIRDLGNCCDIRFKKAEKCSCLQAEMRKIALEIMQNS